MWKQPLWHSCKPHSPSRVKIHLTAALQILEILPLDGTIDVPVNIETRVTAGSYCVI